MSYIDYILLFNATDLTQHNADASHGSLCIFLFNFRELLASKFQNAVPVT